MYAPLAPASLGQTTRSLCGVWPGALPNRLCQCNRGAGLVQPSPAEISIPQVVMGGRLSKSFREDSRFVCREDMSVAAVSI